MPQLFGSWLPGAIGDNDINTSNQGKDVTAEGDILKGKSTGWGGSIKTVWEGDGEGQMPGRVGVGARLETPPGQEDKNVNNNQ